MPPRGVAVVTSVHVLSPRAVGYMAFSELLDVPSLFAAIDRVLEQAEWKRGGCLVFDFLDVRTAVLDLHDLDRIGSFVDERFGALGEGGTTVFVTHDFVVSAICDLFRTKRRNRPRTLRRVDSLATAEALLGLPSGVLTPLAA